MDEEICEGYQLSPQQERLWRLLRRGGDYRWQYAVSLEGALHVPTLSGALRRLVARHEILRTGFQSSEGAEAAFQVINEKGGVHLREHDLGGMPRAEQQAEVERLWREGLSRDFAYEQGMVLHAGLLRLAPESHLLVLCAPALCADAWTMRQMVSELARHYVESCEGRPGEWPEVLQYADYAAWLNELPESEADAAEGLAHWQAAAEVAPVKLPLEREAGGAAEGEGRGEVFAHGETVGEELAARVERFAREAGVETADVLLAAWAALLWRLTGERDVSVEVCSDGRNYDYLRPALGCFAQYLPVHFRLGGGHSFASILKLVGEAKAVAEEWQGYYGSEARRRRDGAAPSGVVGFDYRERGRALSAGGLRVSEWRLEGRGERLKLRLRAEGGGERGGLAVRVECDARLY
ncbi:MAG TPA: condensation domain-containing protein, partial [Pyrinomonadaceae bacterium]